MKAERTSVESAGNHFGNLPEEVKLEIFSYFPPEMLSGKIALVCKNWWRLSKDPSLWTELKFKILSKDKLHTCCENLPRCRLLTSLRITSDFPINDLLKRTGNIILLRKIDIWLSGLSDEMSSNDFQILATNCPLLESLTLHVPILELASAVHVASMVNLRELILSNRTTLVSGEFIQIISRKCTKLERLDFYSLDMVTDEDLRVLSQFRHETLTHLSLSAHDMSDEGAMPISLCQKLITLRLLQATQLTDRALQSLSTLPKLTSFELSGSLQLTPIGLKTFFLNPPLKLLTKLSLVNIKIDDTGLQALDETCKNLRELSFIELRDVTDVGLQVVLKN